MIPEKLLIISPSKFPGTSGDTANYLELINGFRSKRVDVTLLCPWDPEGRPFDYEMKKKGVRISRILINPPRLKDLNDDNLFVCILKIMVFYIVGFFTTTYIILKNRIKFTLIRYGVLTAPILPLLWILHIKFICDVIELPTIGSISTSKALEEIGEIFDERMLSFCKRFKVMSSEVSSMLVKMGVPGDKIFVSHPGMNMEKKPPKTDLEKIPRATFGFFGVLEKWQGVNILLDAFSKVAKTHSDSMLYIIGDGSMADSLKRLTRDRNLLENVIFTGAVPRDVLWNEFLAKFRVLLIPRPNTTSSTLVPMKLIEGLAAGKVIITTPIESIQRTLDSCVLLVSFNSDELADAMLKIIDDEELQEKLCINAMKASMLFDVGRTIDEILNEFEKA